MKKRCNSIRDLATQIDDMCDELDYNQCTTIAKNIKSLYAKHGKEGVVDHIKDTLPSHRCVGGFTMKQKYHAEAIARILFFWHILPWSTIRGDMFRIGAFK